MITMTGHSLSPSHLPGTGLSAALVLTSFPGIGVPVVSVCSCGKTRCLRVTTLAPNHQPIQQQPSWDLQAGSLHGMPPRRALAHSVLRAAGSSASPVHLPRNTQPVPELQGLSGCRACHALPWNGSGEGNAILLLKMEKLRPKESK